jgi:hypothetical protein
MTMLTAIATLLLAAQDKPAPAPEPITIKLSSAPKRGGGELKYEVKTLYPDGIVLRGTLFQLEEHLVEGRPVLEATEIGSDAATVEGKRASFVYEIKGAGLYRTLVEFQESQQDPDLLATLKRPIGGKATCENAVWGDEFVGTLGPKLRDFDQQVGLAVELVRKFAAATTSQKVWKENYQQLDKEAVSYLKKLDQSGLDKVYPAAFNELRLSMRNAKGNAEAMEFGEDGACRGSINYQTKKPTKTIHSEDFSFEVILRDVEATKRQVANEFLLWIIKDFRRAGARTGLAEALRSEHRRPGLGALVDALETFRDVEVVERQLRGGSADK